MKKYLLLLFAAISLVCCSEKDDTDNKVYDVNIPKEELTFSSEASSVLAYVVSEGTLALTVDQSWCTVKEESSTSTKTHKYTVSVTENTQTEDRTAIITVTANGFSGKITVLQAAANGIVLQTSSLDPISCDGGEVSIKVSSNVAYTVSVDAGWLTEATKAETKASMTEKTHTFTAAKNVGPERIATVTFSYGEISKSITVTQETADMGTITATAAEIAAKMYPGWNLGNTMEATGASGVAAETSWQGTPTTQNLLTLVKNSGFNSVRIPCSWDFHSDDSGKIDEAWFKRVREVVDYCISEGLYVELNDHWDNGWIEVLGFSKSSTNYEAVDDATINSKIERLKDIWTQIATYFKDYDEHLLFAGLNEPFQEYNLFNSRHEALTPILEKYNQAFVDAVRSTGGNNAKRTLVVQGPSTNISSTYSYFDIPTDTVDGALMVEVHYYEPWNFCSGDQKWLYYGSANHVSGSDYNCTYGEESYLKEQFEKMYKKFSSKGVPVLIGEYAADRKIVPAGESQAKHDASIKLFYKTVNTYATNYGLVAFAWDINNPTTTGATSTIFKRQDCTVFSQDILDSIMEGVKAGSWLK